MCDYALMLVDAYYAQNCAGIMYASLVTVCGKVVLTSANTLVNTTIILKLSTLVIEEVREKNKRYCLYVHCIVVVPHFCH